jgi:hypothetical protein
VADEKKTPEQGGDPAPGWYPDPVDSEGLRYWDGKRWTVEQAGAQAGPPAAEAGARPLARIGGVAWSVYATFGAFLLFSVANLLYTLDYSDALGAARDGEAIGVGEANDKFDAFNAVSGLGVLFAIALAIGFLVWFHRAYSNAAGLTRQKLRYGTGWSVGAWFIPVFNLWRPKQIANDVWRAGDPKARENSNWNALPVAGIVHWWWAIWILGSVIGGAGGGLLAIDSPLVDHAETPGSVSDSDLEQEYVATTLVAAGVAVQMIGAVLAMMVVRRASERQDALIPDSTA